MSDPRFARLKTDPRFRRIKKDQHKVIVDERFKEAFTQPKKKKDKRAKGRVDKYGRPVADTQEQDSLRRFYRIEDPDVPQSEVHPGPDYARGEVLLESSDEENSAAGEGAESDDEGPITLGRDVTQPIPVLGDDAEIDLDENTYAELDAQVAAYAQANPDVGDPAEIPQTERTRRLAVVNLDWDHVRAVHLYKIFSSVVSPTGAPLASGSKTLPEKTAAKKSGASIARGRILSVKVYPSQFGKERMAREEKEGPPPEVFKKKDLDVDDINERTIYEVGNGEDYDESALRKYQLERLRYYYAIVECDTTEAAAHIYKELDGTELERSANVFDLSFVPEEMTFDDQPRDEATEHLNMPYKGLEFVTDALRHSKVKLTWDEDAPERTEITRRVLSRKEIEENDFKAYIASSSESEEDSDRPPAAPRLGKDKHAERERLRALLLGGGDDTMPEGWGQDKQGDDEADVDMEITFTPGLGGGNADRDETTLEKYQRKMREKKKKRKEEVRGKSSGKAEENKSDADLGDDFFGESDEDELGGKVETKPREEKAKGRRKGKPLPDSRSAHVESTTEELELLAVPDNPDAEPKHFDMKAVIRAEKSSGRKGKKGKKRAAEHENELQEDFAIDVQDDRFKAVVEDHTFAIDPSNPRFKKTKGMAALLNERSRRQQEKAAHNTESTVTRRDEDKGQPSLKSLVESVKRKSAALDTPGVGKRRKV